MVLVIFLPKEINELNNQSIHCSSDYKLKNVNLLKSVYGLQLITILCYRIWRCHRKANRLDKLMKKPLIYLVFGCTLPLNPQVSFTK